VPVVRYHPGIFRFLCTIRLRRQRWLRLGKAPDSEKSADDIAAEGAADNCCERPSPSYRCWHAPGRSNGGRSEPNPRSGLQGACRCKSDLGHHQHFVGCTLGAIFDPVKFQYRRIIGWGFKGMQAVECELQDSNPDLLRIRRGTRRR
jgi:hypothetical protein